MSQHQNYDYVIAGAGSAGCAIAVGVFAFSAPSAEHLVNITRSLKPGGIAIVTVNGKTWQEVDRESKLNGFDQA